MQQPAMSALASLKLTLVGFGILAAGVLHYYLNAASVYWLAAPLFVLAANLLAALLYNPRFRRQGGLLVFHIGLLLVLVLVGIGQLCGLVGQVEIVEGQNFQDAAVATTREGPWHQRAELEAIRFQQGHFRVDYAPLLVRGRTESTVYGIDGDGQPLATRFGDRVPYIEQGYRFQTTPNKGYALILTWIAKDGDALTGAVHLPSFPLRDWKQITSWTTPAGEELDLELEPSVAVPDDTAWTLDSRDAGGQLWLGAGNDRRRLELGQTAPLAGGTLRFDGVRMWMGYQLFYDPTLPWLLAASLIAVLGLAWHFWGKLWSQPIAAGREDVRRQGVVLGV